MELDETVKQEPVACVEHPDVDAVSTYFKDAEGMQVTDEHGFTTDESALPKGYYYSPAFIGTCMAMGLGRKDSFTLRSHSYSSIIYSLF